MRRPPSVSLSNGSRHVPDSNCANLSRDKIASNSAKPKMVDACPWQTTLIMRLSVASSKCGRPHLCKPCFKASKESLSGDGDARSMPQYNCSTRSALRSKSSSKTFSRKSVTSSEHSDSERLCMPFGLGGSADVTMEHQKSAGRSSLPKCSSIVNNSFLKLRTLDKFWCKVSHGSALFILWLNCVGCATGGCKAPLGSITGAAARVRSEPAATRATAVTASPAVAGAPSDLGEVRRRCGLASGEERSKPASFPDE
mmetsp:Transcript_531/g.1419  ORF Transcript_531/g.1419 Transcript_531/m.1419 type:complete len:255 (-) Transcript_531:482-1246(-)